VINPPRPDLCRHHRDNADDLRLRCEAVGIEAVGRPGKILAQAVEAVAEKVLDLLGCWPPVPAGRPPVTDGSRRIVTTLPSWSTAPFLRSLRIGESAMARVCGCREELRQARFLARA
jgi:hypothetical protein